MKVTATQRPFVITTAPEKRMLDVRKYIIPTHWKRKRNISGTIDKILSTQKSHLRAWS